MPMRSFRHGLPWLFVCLALGFGACKTTGDLGPLPELPVSAQEPLRVRTYLGEFYKLSEVTQPPKPLLREPPVYPQHQRSKDRCGNVVVTFVVDPSGATTNLEIISATHPDFADAAMRAIYTWKFEPAKIGAEPVAVRLQVPIVFNLAD